MFKELKILKQFFENPVRELSVRETAKLIKLAPATASKYLKDFAEKSILMHRHERGVDIYKANLESNSYRDLKIYYVITMVRESKLIDALNEFYLKPTIILFGSSAHGYDVEESDIDIAIITEKKADFPNKAKYEKKIRRKLQIFNVNHLKELKNPHLINNVLGGILLQGDLKWM